jgi:dienelactone hydrolase
MRFDRRLIAAALVMGFSASASAEVRTRVVDYTQGDTALEGLVAWNDAVPGKRPGVIVVHEWWGFNEHARNQARRLAESGYVAFALDMFGKGKLAAHPDDAMKFVAEVTKDPAVARARFDAALALLKADPHVDPDRVAAIGYCFGGAVVLNMARAGEDLDAVVTFHGALATQTPAAEGAVKPRILVLAGDADPMVPPAQVEAFKQEMKAAGANFQVVMMPGAKHSFTNPDAGKAGLDGLAYNADADKASWADMLKLFKEVFP